MPGGLRVDDTGTTCNNYARPVIDCVFSFTPPHPPLGGGGTLKRSVMAMRQIATIHTHRRSKGTAIYYDKTQHATISYDPRTWKVNRNAFHYDETQRATTGYDIYQIRVSIDDELPLLFFSSSFFLSSFLHRLWKGGHFEEKCLRQLALIHTQKVKRNAIY